MALLACAELPLPDQPEGTDHVLRGYHLPPVAGHCVHVLGQHLRRPVRDGLACCAGVLPGAGHAFQRRGCLGRLSRCLGFSRAGLVQQLDSSAGSGFSVAGAVNAMIDSGFTQRHGRDVHAARGAGRLLQRVHQPAARCTAVVPSFPSAPIPANIGGRRATHLLKTPRATRFNKRAARHDIEPQATTEEGPGDGPLHRAGTGRQRLPPRQQPGREARHPWA